MSAAELTLWMADYSIEPWGDEKADLRAALIIWASLAPHCKDGIKLETIMDALQCKESKQQTDAEMMAMMKQLTIDMGGKVIE